MPKEEAKAEGKAEAAPAAKAPLFSSTGLIILVVACAACAGVPVLLMKGKGDGAKAHPGGASMPAEESHKGPEEFRMPKVCNTVELDEIVMPYRESSAGGPRKSLKVTVVLELVTKVMGKEKSGGEGGTEMEWPKDEESKRAHEEDEERLKAARKLKHRIYDKICNILRGRVPEDFATNELIDQTRQQIKRALNDEIFRDKDGPQEVVQAVLFTRSQF